MKRILTSAALLAAIAAQPAVASVISIDDSSPTETLHLYMALPGAQTSPGAAPPGSGSPIDLNNPADPANGLSDVSFNQATESLSFTFANHIPWGSDVYLFRYFSEGGGALSDLFVIQGYGGQNPDYITFISSDTLTGDPQADGVAVLANSQALPFGLGTVAETGDWQLAFDTGPDQYYVRSDIPEPASLALVALGLLGVAGVKRRRD